jgi:hypothetical protein
MHTLLHESFSTTVNNLKTLETIIDPIRIFLYFYLECSRIFHVLFFSGSIITEMITIHVIIYI